MKQNRQKERVKNKQSSAISSKSLILASSALLVFVCIVAYYSSLQFGLTKLDDDLFQRTFANRSYNIMDALHSDAFMAEKGDQFYRPLQSISFIISVNLWPWGSHPYSFHLTSLILHCLAVCCLLRLLLRLGYRQELALLGALIYASSPLFAQAVAWIPGCGDLLLGIFGILSFLTLIKYNVDRKPYYLLLHFAAFLLAALSKETALILPIVFISYLLLVEGKRSLNIQNWVLAAAWIAVAITYYFLRKTAIQHFPNNRAFGIRPLFENLRVLPETLGSFVFPFHISVLPSFSLTSTITGFVVMAMIIVIIWKQRKQNRPMVILGCLWFIGLSIPGMMYSQPYGKFAYNYLNHRAYLPMIGILLVLMEAVPDTWFSERRKELYLSGGGIVILLCFLAYNQSLNFRSAEEFYSQAIRTNPESALAYSHRGKLRAETGNYMEAISDYDNALRLYPDYPLTYNNRAEAKGISGDAKEAIADLTKAIELEPENAAFYSNRGRWESELGEKDSALADFNRGIQLDPNFSSTYNNRAVLKASIGDLDGSEADFKEAVRCDPLNGRPLYNLAQIQLRKGNRVEACNNTLPSAIRLQYTEATELYQEVCK